jgi:hypothetical protein
MKKIRRKIGDIAGEIKSSKDLNKKGSIKFKLDAERDKRIAEKRQREEDQRKGARIYEEWKSRLVNRKHTVGETLDKISELINRLDIEIKSPWKDYVINNILNPIAARIHDANVLAAFTVRAVIDCPKCEWGGIAGFHQKMWDEKRCEIDCPECKHRCSQKDGDMITEAEGKEIAAKAKKSVEAQ